MKRLTELMGAKVFTERGERLGDVSEMRSPGKAETEPTFDARPIFCLLCGSRGLLERLGWKQPRAYAVPWSAVLRVGDKRIDVRGCATDYEKTEAA
ncbi:MAG TPA: PRC-barrel domain-containing protein [Rudaea sp.]|jgi:sporulation protein YlmC with PRC-barrel domain